MPVVVFNCWKRVKLTTSSEYWEFRRDITQIVSKYAKVVIDNKEQATADEEDTYYLDANNLYGGAVYRMMPYELVDIEDREQVMEEANQMGEITQDIR